MVTTTDTDDDTPVVSPVILFLQKNPWVYLVVLIILAGLIGSGIYMSNRPAQGTWRFGICRTLMDFEFAFPPTFDIMSVEEQRTSVRMYMAETNPFGNERILQIDCDYQINNNIVKLTKLSIDRKAIAPSRVTYYNKMMPVLMASQLNKDLPPPLPTALDQLKR